MILEISGALLIIGIWIRILLNNNDDIKFYGSALIFLSVSVGFIMCGMLIPTKNIDEYIKIDNLVKTNNVVYASSFIDNVMIVSSNAADYNTTNELKILKHNGLNSYGFKIDEELKYSIFNK